MTTQVYFKNYHGQPYCLEPQLPAIVITINSITDKIINCTPLQTSKNMHVSGPRDLFIGLHKLFMLYIYYILLLVWS